MDAERRHQLKTNELGEAFEKISSFDFTDRRFIGGVVAVVAIVLGYLGWQWWQSSRAKALAYGWSELAAVNTMDQVGQSDPVGRLRIIIKNNSDPGLLAAARLRLASALRVEAQRLPLQRETLLREGIEELDKSIQDKAVVPEWVAAALYAQAGLYEELRRFDDAAARYRSLEDARFAGTPFQMLATARAPSLEELRIDVRFTPGISPASVGPPSSAAPALTPIPGPPGATEPLAEPPPAPATPPDDPGNG